MTTLPKVDVQDVLDNNKIAPVQWGVLAICFLIMFLDGYDTAVAAFVAPVLSKEWGFEPAAMKPVLASVLFGVAFGALAAGPLADRFGRRWVLIASVLVFGVFTLVSAMATSIPMLTWLRLVTGLGLGAAMSNAATLMAEYAPNRRRSVMVAVLFSGFTLGSAGGGLLGGFMVPAFGWQSAFITGGLAPLALALAMVFFLPESLKYLTVKKTQATETIRKVLSRIERRGPIPANAVFINSAAEVPSSKGGTRMLFRRDLIAGTMALWATYFFGLLVIFLLRSWLPTLVTLSGESIQRAGFLAALFDIGGTVGAFGVAWLVDRLRHDGVVSITYLIAGVMIFIFSHWLGNIGLLATGILVLGFLLSGAQATVPAIAAKFYPTEGRASGVAWTLGIGRFGGIAGALVGGTLLQLGWSFATILASLAIPAVIAAAVIGAHIWGSRRAEARLVQSQG
ncbi:MFS transporter [uncultured Brevundimonas sp.]|uniref:MFS transporter n=1 Tax=uncultured Brevundimonas sp. TaxID=213418 RepID=UPI002625559C|nr:MFS transporter [uncultured Brevundimonas sp.]